MKRIIALALGIAQILLAIPVDAAQRPTVSSCRSGWTRVQALTPGWPVHVTTVSGAESRCYSLFATASEAVFVCVGALRSAPEAIEVIGDAARSGRVFYDRVIAGGVILPRNVEVFRDGVLANGVRLAGFDEVFWDVRPDDVVDVRRARREHTLNTAGAALAGIAGIPLGLFLALYSRSGGWFYPLVLGIPTGAALLAGYASGTDSPTVVCHTDADASSADAPAVTAGNGLRP